MSHFFAYLSRMKYIERWGLMRNTRNENIQEHSLQVAMISHSLAIIKNKYFNGEVDPEKAAVFGMFHEVSEVITGDLPTPIKYFNPDIKKAYKDIEEVASAKLLKMLPNDLKEEYRTLLFKDDRYEKVWKIVKAADKICAYLKCIEELKAGNQEFAKAKKTLESEIEKLKMPEVEYFMKTFVPSFSLTLDELN